MASGSASRQVTWSSRWLFVLAAAGSAVGLGNLWRFPYITGENGGGAFVLVYLICIALVGVPVMMAEVLLGRAGRRSPINTMRRLVTEHRRHPAWMLIGWLGMLAGLLILSYYTVIAGWALHYLWLMGSGSFQGISPAAARTTFEQFTANPWLLLLWHSVFTAVTVWIVARGVVKGLEAAIRWFMPLLFVLLGVLLGYAYASEGFRAGYDFMFAVDWGAVTPETVLVALAHAFFTLSVGMGAIMAYGAYLPSNASIASSVGLIAGLDTLVALVAGLVIFPIVFANHLEPGQGPGLMFVTIPLAFGQMPLGALFGALFFMLVAFAAITSTISLSEPALAYLVEEYNAKRSRVAVSFGVLSWLLGIGTVLSFNAWSDLHLVPGRNFFDVVDFLSQSVMLPIGGMLIALFAAWVLPGSVVGEHLGLQRPWVNAAWKVLVGVVAPLGVFAVLVSNVLA
jgi:NSS family neurotransmitter:Na+ symporter